MGDTSKEVYRLAMQGYCCSQIMVKVGLEARGEDNPTLIEAMAGLCGGLHAGLCCGTLTGAACLLSMFDRKVAAMNMIPRIVEWFQMTYSQEYGGISCDEIIDNNLGNRGERCPKIMAETLDKCRELLAEHGYTI
jgi:hypothetical protein